MFCRECGNEMPDGMAACPLCGAPVEPSVQAAHPQQPGYGGQEPSVQTAQPQQPAYGQPQPYQPGYYGQPAWQQPGVVGSNGKESLATAGLILGLISGVLVIMMFLLQIDFLVAIFFLAALPMSIIGLVLSAKGMKSARVGTAIGGLVINIIDVIVLGIILAAIVYVLLMGAAYL